ncbi:hypothetical protein NKH77_07950 [Streptomyces sp. M19]
MVLITPGKADRVVLDEGDGLQNPTSVAVDGDTVYVANGRSPRAGTRIS